MEELNRLYELRKKLEIKLDQISEDLDDLDYEEDENEYNKILDMKDNIKKQIYEIDKAIILKSVANIVPIVFAYDSCPIWNEPSIILVMRRSSPVFKVLPRLLTEFHIPFITSSLIALNEKCFLSAFNSGVYFFVRK